MFAVDSSLELLLNFLLLTFASLSTIPYFQIFKMAAPAKRSSKKGVGGKSRRAPSQEESSKDTKKNTRTRNKKQEKQEVSYI